MSRQSEKLVQLAGGTLLTVFVSHAFISSRLFSGKALDAATLIRSSEGSLSNRISMLLFSIVALPLVLSHRERFLLLLYRCFPLLILVAWFFCTTVWSDAPDLTIRRLIRYSMFLWIAFATVVSLRDFNSFFLAMVGALGLVIAMDLVFVVFLPDLSITHSFTGEQMGFAGIHDHKNSAGPFALVATVAFAGICGAANKWPNKLLAAVFCMASITFLLLTNSKTAIALLVTVPIIVAILLFKGHFGTLLAALAMTIVGTLALVLALTATSVSDVLQAIFKDPTFTGRTDIWAGLIEMIADRPLSGIGWGALWGTSTSANPIVATGTSWLSQVNFLNSGHNDYLDIAAQAGIIGLILSVCVMIHCISSLRKLLLRCQSGSECRKIILSAACIVALLMLCNFTESLLFSAGTPFGYMFVLIYIASQLHKGVCFPISRGGSMLEEPGAVQFSQYKERSRKTSPCGVADPKTSHLGNEKSESIEAPR